MNKEMKLLAKKLTALFLSLALIIGLTPGIVKAEIAKEFSVEIIDCVDTYYNGFNEDVAVASGTYVQVNYGDESDYVIVGHDIEKEGTTYSQEITINYSEQAIAEVLYEEGDVYITITYQGEEVYKEKLYTPSYVDIYEMPTISLGTQIEVAGAERKYCEQYYRIDKTSVSVGNQYNVYTTALDEEEYSDTYMFLYDETGKVIKKNDDTDSDSEFIDSQITFSIPETGERIIGVRDCYYEELINTILVFTTTATDISSFGSDNAEELNVFYEGFNDDVLYVSGTRLQATLDNGITHEWIGYGPYWDDEDDDLDNGIDISFGDINAIIYRDTDNAVYVEYEYAMDDSVYGTYKLFTPVIKPLTDMPEITEDMTTFSTLPWDSANTYYRITAEDKDETWKFRFSYDGPIEDYYYELLAEIYESDGTYIDYYEPDYYETEDDYFFEDLIFEVTVPAGSTKVIALYDYADESQHFNTSIELVEDEEPTDPVDPPTDPVDPPTDPVDPPTDPVDPPTDPVDPPTDPVDPPTEPGEPTTVEPTTVAPTTEAPTTTKVQPTTTKKVTVGKTKVRKAYKKKAYKKIKISLKRIKGVKRYQVQISKKKKFTKKNILVRRNVKKVKITITNKKLRNRKTLWIRARAYKYVKGKKVYGKWSAKKRARIRK